MAILLLVAGGFGTAMTLRALREEEREAERLGRIAFGLAFAEQVLRGFSNQVEQRAAP